MDDSLKFSASDDNKPDLAVSKIQRPRPPKISERIGDHFREKWISYTIAIVASFTAFLIYNFNRDLGKVEGKLEVIQDVVKNDMGEIKSDIKRLDARLQNQDLTILKNQLSIDNPSQNRRQKKTP